MEKVCKCRRLVTDIKLNNTLNSFRERKMDAGKDDFILGISPRGNNSFPTIKQTANKPLLSCHPDVKALVFANPFL